MASEDSTTVPLSRLGLKHIQENPADAEVLAKVATDFREWLNYWHFLDQETGQTRILGEVLWEAQEEFVRQTKEHSWIFFLKARKLGETTIECAYDAWVMRFRDVNARVHLFSRREKAAQELLAAVKFGLERLPDWMRLPVDKATTNEYELRAGPEDRRLAVVYPADKETAVEATCTHGHVDEWARMGNPRKVWQAIEPSMAGSCHIVTTGLGPANYSSTFWRRCMAKDVADKRGRPMYACFIGVLNRPDRNPAWVEAKKRGVDEVEFRQEYPMTWEDALSGGGQYVFKAVDMKAAGTDFRGLCPAVKGRKYVKAWDIGRHQDAAVGIVLDVTDDVHDVVHYVRLREQKYPFIQAEIETVHRLYPGLTCVEKNAAGEAVLENLKIPENQTRGFSTTNSSKARIITALKIATQSWLIKWDPKACDQLDAEMRGYMLPDENVVQDSVMTLAIALEYAPEAHYAGTVGEIVGW